MPFGSLGTIWAEIGLNTKKLDAGLMQSNLKLATADRTITSFGQRLTNASTKLIMAGGLMVGAVAGVGIASIKMAADFEKSMRNVNSISKLSEQRFAEISNEVLQLSTRMPQSAKTLADGLYDIASSGFAGADGMKVLEASAKAASAGMTNTATSAKGITAVLNAYGLEATEAAAISDTMFKTVDKGVITFEELSQNIGSVTGTAHIAGINFNELSGTLAYMTVKGIAAADSTTALNRLILSIIDPSEELAAVLNAAGYESGELALKQVGLVGVMKLVEEASGGSLTKLQEMVPEMRALKAAAALTGSGIEDLTGYMEDFKDTTGATNIALEEQSKALDYQLQIFKNNISAIAILLGTQYIPKLTSATKGLSEFMSEHQKAAVALGNMGLIIIGVLGSLTLLGGMYAPLTKGAGLLTGAFAKLEYALAGIGISGATFLGILGSIVLALLQTGDSIDRYADLTGETEKKIKGFSNTLTEVNDNLRSGKNVQDDYAFAAADLFKEVDKFPDLYDELNPKIQEINRLYEEGKITKDEARDSIIALSKEYKTATNFVWEYTGAIGESTGRTIEQKIAIQDNENAVKSLMAQYPELTRAEAMTEAANRGLLTSIEDNTEAMDDQTESVDDLLESLFKLYNLNQSVTEATWDYEDALAELDKVTKESNSTDRDKQKALFGVQDEMEDVIDAIWREYSAEGTSLQRKEELRKKYIELKDEAVDRGIETEEAFKGIDEQFGIMAGSIYSNIWGTIIPAEQAMYDKGKELDEQKIEPEIKADISRAMKNLDEFKKKMDSIQSKTVTITFKGKQIGMMGAYSMGGIVGYDTGGIIPQIPQAQYGYVTPQTGRKIPVLAEAGEIILNTAQQNNLAEWLMQISSIKPEGGSGAIENNFYISELVVREEADIDKIATRLYDKQLTTQRGMGVK